MRLGARAHAIHQRAHGPPTSTTPVSGGSHDRGVARVACLLGTGWRRRVGSGEMSAARAVWRPAESVRARVQVGGWRPGVCWRLRRRSCSSARSSWGRWGLRLARLRSVGSGWWCWCMARRGSVRRRWCAGSVAGLTGRCGCCGPRAIRCLRRGRWGRCLTLPGVAGGELRGRVEAGGQPHEVAHANRRAGWAVVRGGGG